MSRRRLRRTKRTLPPLVLAGAAGVAVTATTAAVVLRRRRRTLDARPGTADWRCDCGQHYRFTGQGRHRVYWPAGADAGEPVIGATCVSCDRPLPVT